MGRAEACRHAATQRPLLIPEQLLARLEVRRELPGDVGFPQGAGMTWARKLSWGKSVLPCPTPRN